VRFSPEVIKFCIAVHTISEKAIRFRHLDYNPDRAQKLISSSMSRPLSTCNISSKSIHAFSSNLATDRQTDRQINEHGQKHIPPPLSEVNKWTIWDCLAAYTVCPQKNKANYLLAQRHQTAAECCNYWAQRFKRHLRVWLCLYLPPHLCNAHTW